MTSKGSRNVAIIILYDDAKCILLQHRDEGIEKLPGYWAFFGGGIEEGERPEDAAHREAKEELGYALANHQLVMTQEYIGTHHDGTKYIYMEQYNPSQTLALKEGQGMRWVSLAETKDLKMIGHDRIVLEYIDNRF